MGFSARIVTTWPRDWGVPGRKKIDLPVGESPQRIVLEHDMSQSKGWSSDGWIALNGDEMQLCLEGNPPKTGELTCSGNGDYIVLRRVHASL